MPVEMTLLCYIAKILPYVAPMCVHFSPQNTQTIDYDYDYDYEDNDNPFIYHDDFDEGIYLLVNDNSGNDSNDDNSIANDEAVKDNS